MFTSQARWIRRKEAEKPNRYTEFMQDFELNSLPQTAPLYISVEDEYALYLNGELVDCGMYDDEPTRKSIDTIELAPFLRTGQNQLRILTHWQGVNSFQNVPGAPRLRYCAQVGDVLLASGAHTLCRPATGYRQGPLEKVSPQLSFSFHFDAAQKYAPWEAALVLPEDSTQLYPRPIKKLTLLPPVAGHACMQGVLREDPAYAEETPARRIQTDLLAPRTPAQLWREGGEGLCPQDITGYDGFFAVFDLGREEAGFPLLEVDAPEGTVIDVGYGEHLDDGRVRAWVGGRNFAFRYVCRAGRQRFCHPLKRIAGRYMQVHVRTDKPCTLNLVGLIPAEYPVARAGAFSCADSLINRIWEVSVRTLHLCMHEHYEDCPWREQALYAMDSRNQALAGYYAFGEYDFPAASFRLLADTLRTDGYLEICAPCRYERTIPSFTYAWVIEVGELYRFSGDAALVRPLLDTVRAVLGGALAHMEGGLLPNPQGAAYWHFYEWAPTLDGEGDCGGRIEAPLNLFLYAALREGAGLLEALGEDAAAYRQAMREMKGAFHAAFWQESEQAYRTIRGQDGPLTELCQSLALLYGLVPESLTPALRERLSRPDNGMVRTTLSHYIYKIDALMQEPRYAAQILDDIRRDWGMMLYRGATSFWETIHGADDFAQAGSLCHGWSGVPVYFLARYVLGAYPEKPGFADTALTPSPVLAQVSGVIPLPGGKTLPVGSGA